MVRKLYKHEFLALFKWIIPLNLLCLVLAMLTRINLEVSKSDINDVIAGIMAFAFVLSVIALVTLSFVIVVSRFYKNLLSYEGYLTFTVPVSSATHIVCKLLCGTAVMLVSFVILGLSLGIVGSGAFEYFPGINLSYVPTHRIVMLAVSYGIYAVVYLMHGLLFTYAAMALGQMSKKNRVVSAIGWYFVINIGRSMIKNVINGLMAMNSGAQSGGSIYIGGAYYVESAVMAVVDGLQFTAISGIIEAVIWGAVFFGITYYILTHKLNLE